MKEKFTTLPKEIQEEIKSCLTCYDRCDVTYEYGEYNVSLGIVLKDKYAPDYKFIGEYHKDEIFTSEEQIINYVESFHAYPIDYKGKRDYVWLKSLINQSKVKLDDNGNLVDAEKVEEI